MGFGGKPLRSRRRQPTPAFVGPEHSASNRLVLVVSAHVDDLKGAGLDQERENLVKFLEKMFGKHLLSYLRAFCQQAVAPSSFK